jgi:hypothetical protein
VHAASISTMDMKQRQQSTARPAFKRAHTNRALAGEEIRPTKHKQKVNKSPRRTTRIPWIFGMRWKQTSPENKIGQ